MKVKAASSKDGQIVMQLSVIQTDAGFEVETHFAEGYDEQGLLDVVEMWAEFEVEGEEPSPGWGRP